MIKYSVPNALVQELMDLGLCETEEIAREKVASGEAPDLIKEAKLKILDTSEGLYAEHSTDPGDKTSS